MILLKTILKKKLMTLSPSATYQLINGIYLNIPILNNKITEGFVEITNYLETLKNENFEYDPNETEDDEIKRAEGIIDRLDEMLRRNEISNNKTKEILKVVEEMVKIFEGMIENTEQEKEIMIERNNCIIDKIIDLEEKKINSLIDLYPNKKGMYRGMFDDKKEEWINQKIVVAEKKLEEWNNTSDSSLIQIEEWTKMKLAYIIFDSDIDNWSVGTSVFNQKIQNKSNLVFLIEDGDNNLFGGFVNVIINRHTWIIDTNAFVFSLKSNGRLNGMMKFNIVQANEAFYLYNQFDDYLFAFGNDIFICKENKKNQSTCKQSNFNYNGIQNALCGKFGLFEPFTPKRIRVIQLI